MPRTRRFSRALGAMLALVITVTLIQFVDRAEPAEAVTAADWNPELIIDDALFYDQSAMTAAEIQAFLNSKIGTCLNGQCLNVLSVTIGSRAAVYSARTGNLVCTAIQGGTYTAAQLIYLVQVACSISAKVILVTLQKEQGLTTHSSPSAHALARAMGQACPDTAPCNPGALGFANQILQGTEQLQTYRAGAFARQPGVQHIGYHPNSACGGTTINIRNYATAALYNYTPYQPNTAALANMYGTGDGCSSYGNRNFWRFYNDWFGPTRGTPNAAPDDPSVIWAVNSSGTLMLYSSVRGAWRAPVALGPGWSSFTHVFGIADATADGARDLLALNASGQLRLYPSNGSGGFGDSTIVATGLTSVSTIFSPGDFDGDGIADLLVVTKTGQLLLAAGTGGGFSSARTIGWGWNSMRHVIGPGDFNGDGAVDVIAADTAGFLWLYPGTGAGGLGPRVQIGNGWSVFNALISAGDFDGNGTIDVVARKQDGTLHLFRGNGRGGWLSSLAIGQGWAGFSMLSGGGPAVAPVVPQAGIGDWTGDRNRDVLALTPSGTVSLYPGTGTGGWSSPSTVATGWDDARLWAAADFTGDRLADLLIVTTDGSLWLRAWNGASFESAVRLGSGWGSTLLITAPGDLNGDGRSDLIAKDDGGRLWLYPGVSGGFGARVQIGSGWGAMTAIFAAGDFDGDGRHDIIARSNTGLLYLYSGNGAGGFGSGRVIGNGWASFTAVFSPGDVTGDRIPDVLARTPSGALMLYPGNGTGGWLASRQVGNGWQAFSLLI